MKKALGQTVRDLKRGVNKKVLKVPGIEQKILDATSNEPWGPHGSHLADIAQATRNYQDHKMVMNVIWKRINDTGKNWRHVHKALIVLEYLVAHGSDRILDEIREHSHQISTLSNFQYIDSGGRDQGGNVRRKSQSLVALVDDREKLHEVRQKAKANKDKPQSTISASPASKPSYSDRGYRDDDQNSNGRERDYGNRNDERYGRGRDSYSQDGYRDNDYQVESRGSIDRYTERSVDEDDRHSTRSGSGRGDNHSHDDRHPERHLHEENDSAPPSYEEATKDVSERDAKDVASPTDRSSSQSAPNSTSLMGSGPTSPDQAVSAESPTNKEMNIFDEFDPRGSAPAVPPSATDPGLDFFGSLSAPDSANSLALMLTTESTTSEAAMPTTSGFGMDFAAPSATPTVWSKGDGNPFGDPPFKATPQEDLQGQHQNFAPVYSSQPSSGSIGSAGPFPPAASNMEATSNFDFGDILGGLAYPANDQHSSSTAFSSADTPFAQASTDVLDGILPWTDSASAASSHGTHQTDMFSPQADQVFPQATQSAAPNNIQATHLNFPQHTDVSASSPSQAATPNYMLSAHQNFFQQSPSQGAQHVASFSAGNNMQLALSEHSNIFQQPGLSASVPSPSLPPSFPSRVSQPSAPANTQSGHSNLPQQPGASMPVAPQVDLTTAFGPPAKVQPTKFQPKSTVWADTMSRGLVDFNISGAKVNPLSDIGIDFESMNRKEKRKEVKSSITPVMSTVTMGKAMGAGSGIGRTAATGITPSPNPMLGSGMGMGMGGGAAMGMNSGMSMGGSVGMRNGMNQTPMGMGMTTGAGGQMWPPNGMPMPGTGTPGIGYNPMMGMANYGPQQSYGGAPQQQQFGGGYR